MQSTARPVVKILVGFICAMLESALLCLFVSNYPSFGIRVKE